MSCVASRARIQLSGVSSIVNVRSASTPEPAGRPCAPCVRPAIAAPVDRGRPALSHEEVRLVSAPVMVPVSVRTGGHRWAASPCAPIRCNPIRRRTSEGDRRRQYMSSLSTGWSEAGLGVGRRQATRAAAVGFRGSIGWVVGAARSRWRPICRMCLAACARVWCGAQRRERVQNESGSGRAWARKAGEATVRPGAR